MPLTDVVSKRATKRAASSRATQKAATDPRDIMVERAMLEMHEMYHPDGVKCGRVAGDVWAKFTGQSRDSLNARSPSMILPSDCSWKAVGLTFTGASDHQLVFIVTPTGRAHTLQSFFPLIRRPHYFWLNVANLKGALSALSKETAWTDKYCAAFNELTHISQAQRFMEQDGIEGFVMDKMPLEGAEQLGISYMQARRRGIATAPRIMVADIPVNAVNDMMRQYEYIGGGASRRSRPKKWISTGRQTTLKDGSRRTVYRAGATGARATKRMVARNGKTFARYVELSADGCKQ